MAIRLEKSGDQHRINLEKDSSAFLEKLRLTSTGAKEDS